MQNVPLRKAVRRCEAKGLAPHGLKFLGERTMLSVLVQGEHDSEFKIVQQRRAKTTTSDKCTKPPGTGTDYPAIRRCHTRLTNKSYADRSEVSCSLCEEMRKKEI